MTDPPIAGGDPFVMLPVELLNLVADGKISKNGAWLYVLLLSHVNYKRGDGKVWPSRKSLSQRMNLGQVRGVDKYIDELTDAGLIVCDRRRDGKVNDTNLYTLQLLPPRPPTSNVSPDQGVVRSGALGSASQRTRGSAPESTRVVRPSAPELQEVELKENQLNETSSPVAPSTDLEVADGKTTQEEGEVEISSKPEPQDHTATVADLITPYAHHLAAGEQRRLSRRITEAITNGWRPDQIAHILAEDLTGLQSVAAGLIRRVADLGPTPYELPNASPSASRCPHCEGKGTTWMEMFQTTIDCEHCGGAGVHNTQEPVEPTGPCDLHPGQKARTCGPCASERRGVTELPDRILSLAETRPAGGWRNHPRRRSTGALRAEQALRVADELDAEHGTYYGTGEPA